MNHRAETITEPPTTSDPAGWVDRHGDGLYRYALLHLRRAELAADAVQETFLEALRSRSSFAGRSGERTWLVGILRHKVLDHYRRIAREQRRDRALASADDGVGPEAEVHARTPSSRPWASDPSQTLENAEFWETFHACLAKLPPGLADAFLQRELDEIEPAEVQRNLDITAANLWKRIHRARVHLRGCLARRWFGRPE